MTTNTFMDLTIKNKLTKYLRATKLGKGYILEQLEQDTGRHRKALIRRLNQLKRCGKQTRTRRRGRPRKYTPAIRYILAEVYKANDYICAERLHPGVSATIQDLLAVKELQHASPEDLETVCSMPLGSLKNQVAKIAKPSVRQVGSRKSDITYRQIPIRSRFKKDAKPGYWAVDFVDHTGDDQSGRFVRTLDMVDPQTTYICRRACLGKDKHAVSGVFNTLLKSVPYTINGLHSDNEPSLLNVLLQRNAQDNGVFITRTRSYQSNDNAHVEQKNGNKVRELVGYYRYDTERQRDILNQIYEIDDLFQNHFIPSYQLVAKEYNSLGKLVRKQYGKAQTAYQRIMNNPHIVVGQKEKLVKVHDSLNRVQLKLDRDKLIKKLFTF